MRGDPLHSNTTTYIFSKSGDVYSNALSGGVGIWKIPASSIELHLIYTYIHAS